MFLLSRYMLKAVTPTVLALGMIAPAAAEFRFTPYGAVGGNFSHLTPDVGNSGFEVTGENSGGFSLMLGADLFDRLSIEAGFNDLGSATLEGIGGEEDISYTATSFSALFHLLGNASDIAERRGGWTYLRLGVSQIDNDSSLILEEENSTAFWAGVGYEYSVNSFLSLRGEIATFDGDAQAITAAVVIRPFSGPSSSSTDSLSGGSIAQTRPSEQPVPAPVPPPVPPPVPEETPRRLPIPSSPVVNAPSTRIASCESPVGNEPVGANGCALLSGIRPEIQFENESPRLLPESLSAIANLAGAMNQAPNLRVELRTHAESVQGDNASQQLSKQRVLSVARALVAAGVDVKRLSARAFGNQQPIVNSGSAAGQVIPNRVEFLVSP